MRRDVALFALIAVLLLSVSPAAAQKGGKPPAERPGTLSISPNCVTGDPQSGIEGDCVPANAAAAIYTSTDGTGTSVRLNTAQEIRATLYGHRWLRLDFGRLAEAPQCTTCYSDFSGSTVKTDLPYAASADGPWNAVMQTNVVDADGNEVTGGVMGIPVGQARNARFYVTFPDPQGRPFHWSARYYPQLYPNSNYAVVTHVDACTWTIASTGNHQAGLIAYGVSKGKNTSSREGLFVMPFSMTFTLDGCTP